MAFRTAVDIATQVSTGALSATSVLEEHLARIGEREGEIHAFNLVTAEDALAAADAVGQIARRHVHHEPRACSAECFADFR